MFKRLAFEIEFGLWQCLLLLLLQQGSDLIAADEEDHAGGDQEDGDSEEETGRDGTAVREADARTDASRSQHLHYSHYRTSCFRNLTSTSSFVAC